LLFLEIISKSRIPQPHHTGIVVFLRDCV